jgi:hypothetical protein
LPTCRASKSRIALRPIPPPSRRLSSTSAVRPSAVWRRRPPLLARLCAMCTLPAQPAPPCNPLNVTPPRMSCQLSPGLHTLEPILCSPPCAILRRLHLSAAARYSHTGAQTRRGPGLLHASTS